MPRIVKRGGARVPFNEDKLRGGVMLALEKRPVAIEQIDEALNRIKHNLMAAGEREVESEKIGDWVMDELLTMDHVAYIRFASVYLDFGDVNAFREAVERLEQKALKEKNK